MIRIHSIARALTATATLAVLATVSGCERNGGLETRTFAVRYLAPHVVDDLIDPYVFADREANPGRKSVTESAVTVRETPDNLERIERVLAQFDRPRPTVALRFQVIRADGGSGGDPAIANVERELRRLFRFDGYELVAETRVSGIAGTMIRQQAGRGGDRFMIETGVTEVRNAAEPATITLDVRLSGADTGTILETGVTVAEGQSIVLGTAQLPDDEGALILVVRADLVEASAGNADAGGAGAATGGQGAAGDAGSGSAS